MAAPIVLAIVAWGIRLTPPALAAIRCLTTPKAQRAIRAAPRVCREAWQSFRALKASSEIHDVMLRVENGVETLFFHIRGSTIPMKAIFDGEKILYASAGPGATQLSPMHQAFINRITAASAEIIPLSF